MLFNIACAINEGEEPYENLQSQIKRKPSP